MDDFPARFGALSLIARLLAATAFAQGGNGTPYDFTTYAGSLPGNWDGTGGAARFGLPEGAAVDGAGNIYVTDTSNCTIRKVTPAVVGGVNSWVVTTLAGAAGQFGNFDGTGSAARFYNPAGLAVDSAGNLYVADTGNRTIRKITPSGAVTTLAGEAGVFGHSDGVGTAATFGSPEAVAVDAAGNVYVADFVENSRSYGSFSGIRKITPSGVVTTLAGGGVASFGSADGEGTAAQFEAPSGIAVDGQGNVYVADSGNDTIRKITSGGNVTTLAGTVGVAGHLDETGTAARFNDPMGVAVDSAGTVYVADSGNNTIRAISPSGNVSTLAGAFLQRGGADGTGINAQFSVPYGLAVDGSGSLYVADSGNLTVREVTPGAVVTTLAGTAGEGQAGSEDGTGPSSRFTYPSGVASDSVGNVYVADMGNDTIRKIAPGAVVTTLAGQAGQSGSADGTGSSARFFAPTAVAVDGAGNVYVADTGNYAIRKITPAGMVTTLAGGSRGYQDGTGSAARISDPTGLAVDGAGNIFVADAGNNSIREVSPAGVVTTLAGSANQLFGDADGVGTAARFWDPVGVAVDGSGNIYVADSSNYTIRKVTQGGVVTTVAGSAGLYGSVDGIGSAARFELPQGVAVDDFGNVFVADGFTIREVSPAGVVTTLAGTAESTGAADGTGISAQFDYAHGIAVDASDHLFVADTDNHCIREGEPAIGPYVTVQPASQAVNAGSGVVLALAAFGNSPLSYQWYFAGIPIPGATGSALSVANVQPANAGVYQVNITDQNGTDVSSGAAVLTVTTDPATSITMQPQPQTVATGGTVVFTVSTTAPGQAQGMLAMTAAATTYQWFFNGTMLADGNGLSGTQGPQLVLQGATPADDGDYSCVVTTPGAISQSNTAGLIVSATSTPGSLTALSGRAFVGTGDNILIGGFFIAGSTSATVLVQAIGPALSKAPYNVAGTLQHPALTIHRSQNGKDVVLYSNTGWGSSPVVLAAAATAFAEPVLQPGSPDSEVLLTLPPGGYTAEVTGADGGTGVALCAIYQLQ
jgi:sugar lactone lactonase YvrE